MRALGITRVALSRFLNEQTALSAKTAIRLDNAFGADMESLMRMQAATTSPETDGDRAKSTLRGMWPEAVIRSMCLSERKR